MAGSSRVKKRGPEGLHVLLPLAACVAAAVIYSRESSSYSFVSPQPNVANKPLQVLRPGALGEAVSAVASPVISTSEASSDSAAWSFLGGATALLLLSGVQGRAVSTKKRPSARCVVSCGAFQCSSSISVAPPVAPPAQVASQVSKPATPLLVPEPVMQSHSLLEDLFASASIPAASRLYAAPVQSSASAPALAGASRSASRFVRSPRAARRAGQSRARNCRRGASASASAAFASSRARRAVGAQLNRPCNTIEESFGTLSFDPSRQHTKVQNGMLRGRTSRSREAEMPAFSEGVCSVRSSKLRCMHGFDGHRYNTFLMS
eukprot:TRINITY_DN30525_c0_g1_i1.p1 TRINITY_DN30525_c0_g1~~TRINITY_DN30525_c0_g1_i1.p1  ORF type:complete len:320 (-),score=52.42 TRINITY_DN30525_c0_g1_i1:188-1147(-)